MSKDYPIPAISSRPDDKVLFLGSLTCCAPHQAYPEESP